MEGRFEIVLYVKENGECPIDDFLCSVDSKMRAKLLRQIDMLAEYGNTLREPYSKSLDDGIFEIRVKQGSDITRVLYFFFTGKKAVLTNGFVKKTQETPPGEILLAKKYRKDYMEREAKQDA